MKVTEAGSEQDATSVSEARATQPRAGAVRWSAASVFGRQASQMASALVLARILGPESYGYVSAATLYVTLTTLALDQGLAAALIQRPTLTARAPGAVATVNLVMGVLLAGLTWLVAPAVAEFFSAPALEPLVQVLGVGLLIKSAAITPRAMASRQLDFRTIAVADIAGGVLGAVAGISAALAGAGPWSLVWQVLVTDTVVVVALLGAGRGAVPNRHLREFLPLLPFSLRIFGTNTLAYASRNADNILVGRFLGVGQLSLYGMAYRVLVIPVQLIGQTVGRVAFPALSRLAGDPLAVRALTLRTTKLLALYAVPPMVLASVAATELVDTVLGDEWAPAAPVLAVLALAGARETVMQVTHSLMRAMGAGKLILRYEIGASVVQLGGIVIGLRYGILGVAVGFSVAGLVMTPVLMTLQKRLAGVGYRAQLAGILPAVHASVWGAAAYAVLRLLDLPSALTLVIGGGVYVAVGAVVLRTAHRRSWELLLSSLSRQSRGR